MDYRDSHLDRGGRYDATIAGSPFDAYMARREAECLREIVPTLEVGRGRYLDFACGTGRITATVAPLVGETFGVDVSESMLADARPKCPSARFVCADLTRDRVDLGQFDLVTTFRFFGNAQDELRIAVLGVLGALTRPGGFLVINNHRNPHALAALLHRASGGASEMDLTAGKLRRMLRDHGFRIVRIRPIGVWAFRSRLQATAATGGRAAELAERMLRQGFLAPIAPDAVIVAQRQ